MIVITSSFDELAGYCRVTRAVQFFEEVAHDRQTENIFGTSLTKA